MRGKRSHIAEKTELVATNTVTAHKGGWTTGDWTREDEMDFFTLKNVTTLSPTTLLSNTKAWSNKNYKSKSYPIPTPVTPSCVARALFAWLPVAPGVCFATNPEPFPPLLGTRFR